MVCEKRGKLILKHKYFPNYFDNTVIIFDYMPSHLDALLKCNWFLVLGSENTVKCWRWSAGRTFFLVSSLDALFRIDWGSGDIIKYIHIHEQNVTATYSMCLHRAWNPQVLQIKRQLFCRQMLTLKRLFLVLNSTCFSQR